MSAHGGGGKSAKAGPGGRTKSGKPRPGTGGHGRRKLEGKGPTPPAELRPGHPAQRRRGAVAAGGSGPSGSGGATRGSTASPRAGTAEPSPAAEYRARRASRSGSYGSFGGAPGVTQAKGAGAAPEVVAGRNAVLESLRARVPALALHVGPRLDADDRISEAIKLAADVNVPVVEAGRFELDRLTGGAVHQGLALRIRPYPYAHADDLIGGGLRGGPDQAPQPLIVALDGVTDPRNLGAVARSVAAFGGNGVLIPVRRSAGVTAGAWKASAGALARVRVAQATNLARALASYARSGLFVVGLDASADDDIASLSLAQGPLVLVIGSEGKGLSRLVAQQCDLVVRIPISGAESLNVGVAAGIALYQVSLLRAAADEAAPGSGLAGQDGGR